MLRTLENIYVGYLTWLALGCPHAPWSVAAATPTTHRPPRAVLRSALETFRRSWTEVCRERSLSFSGGRAGLARQVRQATPYCSTPLTPALWREVLEASHVAAQAAFVLPVEEVTRGEPRPLVAVRQAIPLRGAYLPAAELVEERRPDLAKALREPEAHRQGGPPDERLPVTPDRASRTQMLGVLKRFDAAQMLTVLHADDVPRAIDGGSAAAPANAVSKDADQDHMTFDRRRANASDRDVRCERMAHAAMLQRRTLRSEEADQICVSDLPDYFHALDAGRAHDAYNAVGPVWSAGTLREASIAVPDVLGDDAP